MPDYTVKYQFPSPRPNETADGPKGFQQLAQRVEDVLFTQFGKVSYGPSGEVTFSGSGTSGDPLKANLTGTREGNWNATGEITAPAGNITAGSLTSGTAYAIRSHRLVNGLQMQVGLSPTTLAGGAIGMYFFGDLVNKPSDNVSFLVNKDGEVSTIQTVAGVGTTRPQPFAIFAADDTLVWPNSILASKAITLPPKRFTHNPLVLATPVSSGAFLLYMSGTSTTSITISGRHVDGLATSYTLTFETLAIQMTAAASQGLRESVDTHIATCTTQGCEHEGVAVPVYLPPEGGDVSCGLCRQPITDVVEV